MKRREHVELIDYLRGFAALAVAWFHMTGTASFASVKATGFYGWLGVEIFFVISGFVIFIALDRIEDFGRLQDYPRFFAKRLIRLEPPYLASIALTIALWYLSTLAPGFRGMDVNVQWQQLLFHLAYLIPFTSYGWIQPPYWTLSYEFFFYIAIALLFPAFDLGRRGLGYAVAALALAVATVAGLASPLIMLFVMGTAIARAHCERSGWPEAWAYVVLAAVAMVTCGKGLEAGVGAVTVAVIAAHDRISRPPEWLRRPLVFFGAISYSLYLIHVPVGGRVVNLGKRVVETPLQEFAVAVLALAISIAVATVFWWVVERPAMRAASRLRVRPGSQAVKG